MGIITYTAGRGRKPRLLLDTEREPYGYFPSASGLSELDHKWWGLESWNLGDEWKLSVIKPSKLGYQRGKNGGQRAAGWTRH